MGPILPRTARRAAFLAWALTLCCALAGAHALAAAPEVVVIAVQGEVSVAAQGAAHTPKKGEVVSLPAAIVTGATGSIELAQGATTVSAAPNSAFEIPAPAVAGDLIDHIVQSRGNAFFSVAKREVRKLRVETAYLVAVVKGTQFSVLAQDDSSTISLFEGHLEIHASDESDVIQLGPGEIAIRHAGDRQIRMLRMDSGEPVSRVDPGALGTVAGDGGAISAPAPLSAQAVGTESGTASEHPSAAPGTVLSPVTTTAALAVNGAGVSGAVSAGNGTVSAGAGASLGGASASASVGLSSSAAAVSAGATVNAAVGGSSATVGVSTGLSASGASAGTTAGVSTPAASASAGLTSAAGPSGVSAATTASVSTPVSTASAGLSTSGSPSGTSVALTAGASTPVATPTVTTSISTGTGTTLGLSVSTPLTGTTSLTLGTSPTGSGTSTSNNPTGSSGSSPSPGPANPIKTLLGH